MVKWIKQWALAEVISVLVVFSDASIASACPMKEAFDVRDIDVAEVVFRGRIEAHEQPPERHLAKLRFVVDETYRGPRSVLSWEALWRNSTFGLPESLSEYKEKYGMNFIVGLSGYGTPTTDGARQYVGSEADRELLSHPWIL